MKLFLVIAFAASMCESPVTPSVDAGDATCADAWEVARGCTGFALLGPDELPDSGDEPSWVDWCERYNASGIDSVNTGCIAASVDCAEAEGCLDN